MASFSQELKPPQNPGRFKEAGDVERIKSEFFKGFHTSLTSVTLGLEVYVTSFCYTNPGADAQDGLLSQWRGYGHDGGYAIVFNTKALSDLLAKEQEKYSHPFFNFSDVDYHNDDWVSDLTRHDETLDWEHLIREIISQVVEHGDLQTKAEELFMPIVAQAIRHKHRGFKEEQEVRISAVRLPKKIINAVGEDKRVPHYKQVKFYPRSGVLVPYISFFDGIPDEERKLPIKEIVVGPHRDKLRRQQAVQMLLEELEIQAEVRVSDIPFLGR